MRKIIEIQYNKILMKSGCLNWFDLMLIGVSNYFMFPELRKRDYGKYARWMSYCIVAYLTLALFVDVYHSRSEAMRREAELEHAYDRMDFLVANASDYVYGQVKDSFLVSEDYLRFKMYTETGMVVPSRVSEEHIRAIDRLAKKHRIPLSIYLRVIYHESRFDSTAVNETSGAFGFCQMMPITFNHLYSALKLEGGRTATNNLKVGAELLSREFKYWCKRRKTAVEAWEMSLACYAMGDSLPRAMDAVPNAVRPYVDYILHTKGL